MRGINFIFFYFLFSTIHVYSQKLSLDSTDLGTWPSVDCPAVSADGKYFSYTIVSYSYPISNYEMRVVRKTDQVIESIERNWKIIVPDVESPAAFTADNKYAVFKKGDSLGILRLGDNAIEYMDSVESYKICAAWIAYRKRRDKHELVLKKIKGGETHHFANIIDYRFVDNSSVLLSCRQSGSSEALKWLNLPDFQISVIWKGSQADHFVVDKNTAQVCFTAVGDNKDGLSLWLFKKGWPSAHIIISGDSLLTKHNAAIAGVERFTDDGRQVFFSFKKNTTADTLQSRGVKVVVWKYSDSQLPTVKKHNDRSFAAVCNLSDNRMIILEKQLDRVYESRKETVMIFHDSAENDYEEWYWNPACQKSVYVINTKSGEKRWICRKNTNSAPYLSPDGDFVVYYDPAEKNYFSVDIKNSITRNITQQIITDWAKDADNVTAKLSSDGFIGWVSKNKSVLIRDRNDIWLLDLYGRASPENLTNGFGKKNNILFRIAVDASNSDFNPDTQILLSAFNSLTKDNGFFFIQIDKERSLHQLTMGPYVYNIQDGSRSSVDLFGMKPLKCPGSSKYIVRRMSAAASPNYFITNDFKQFTALSDIHPEKKYNWFTTELVNFKTPDGKSSQGILYKPDNFDSTKKYPVIVHFYEQLSDMLHVFLYPDGAHGDLNIPWMLSKGYLVFIPDVHYQIGEPGVSACNAVVAATQFLLKRSYIDEKHLGLQAHSFGGYEVNYIISHSDLFAAACSSAGLSNLAEMFSALWGDGRSKQGIVEVRQVRMGVPPWKAPEAYLRNSPIYFADKVHTPLLFMHNKDDGNVDFEQGLGFFLAMRRLGKPAWLLQYENEGHVVSQPAAARDYNRRMTQFFDHYLKNAPVPDWMKPE